MDAKQKICLVGGTFDPIHLGHTYIAEKCYRELSMDKIIFLPCKQSPHKLDKQNAPDHHRLEMCKLATAGLPWAKVSDIDLTAPAPSYSWRTAETIKARYSDAKLYWLMGTDQWKTILKWDRPQHLASLVSFIIVTRGEKPQEVDGLSFQQINGVHAASATIIRNNPHSPQAHAWLHPDVRTYIENRHIY